MNTIAVATNTRPEPPNTQQTAVMSSLSSQQCDLIHEALISPLDYVPNPLFCRRTAEDKLFSRPVSGENSRAVFTRVLKADEEMQLFLRFNYARMRVRDFALRFQAGPERKTAVQLAGWQQRVCESRDRIINANLGLVLTMARRSRIAELDPDDLISEGNIALLRAVERFDVSRGFKFSTYACRAIIMAFSRVASGTIRRRNRFPVPFDISLERSNETLARRQNVAVDAAEDLHRIIVENSARLSDIERRVIESRFAINRGEEIPTMTLQEVGDAIGITKERVRQIQQRALEKLRSTLDREFLRR